MAASTTDTDRFVASIHRAILGVLLALAAVFGLGLLRTGVSDGNVPFGIAGLAIAAITIGWIVALFREGLRER
ncbi:hypothetical protein HTZ84_20420 [Haloterrigena sp. SYSU A558-1]|uniref:Major facilitator superfamily (MFS) profile domain-containing protein n=1 Tax=Haloterrigena gelatinilytica TaxID=2741724 RepID=A0ABX2LEF8_9EURY|nr:hypothetical protein [Haloterrigena gelatinilytica]NUC74632.1 hypothetical protein [Haloterrigena gelatinilytica]